MDGEREMVRYDEAAEITGLCRSTLQSMVCRGQVPHYRLGRRLVVFSRQELEAWLGERHKTPSTRRQG